MKSLTTLLIAALMVVSMSAIGFAQSSAAGNETYGSSGTGIGGNEMNTYGQDMDQMMTSGEDVTYSGTVVSMMDHTLIVRGNQGEKTFDLSNVTVSGSLNPGDEVEVAYHTDDNGNIVVSSVTPGVKTSMNNTDVDQMMRESGNGQWDPYGSYQGGIGA